MDPLCKQNIIFSVSSYIIVGGENLIFGTIKTRSKDICNVHGTGVFYEPHTLKTAFVLLSKHVIVVEASPKTR